jgi:hypothetical protein
MKDAVDNAKKSSENLKKQMTDELIPEINNELIPAIGNATGAWELYRRKLEEVIKLADEAMKKTEEATKKAAYSNDYGQDYIDFILGGGDANSDKAKRILKERQEKIDVLDMAGTVMTNEELVKLA